MSKISFFQPFGGMGAHVSNETTTIDEFLHHIKYGRWQEQINEIRGEEDKKKRSLLKKKLPSVTISGLFTTRRADDLIQHSGYICIDIDNYTEKEALLADPYTYALFASTSGTGLVVLMRINPEKHKESFRWIAEYYYKSYGIVVDPAPSSVASLRFVSLDVNLFINEKAKQALTKESKERRRSSLPLIYDGSIVSELVEEARAKQINIAESYEDYRNIAFAIAEGFGESGRQYFLTIASVSSKFKDSEANRQYDIALRSKRTGITVGTFYWMLKQGGITLPDGNSRSIRIAGIAKRNNRSKEAVKQQLVQLEQVSEEVAEQVVEEVFKRDDLNVENTLGDSERVIESVIEFLRQNHVARKNKISGKIEVNGDEITDEKINTIYLQARMFFKSDKVTKDLVNSIIFSEITDSYHPIQEYIEKNSHRKGTGYIDTLISCIETETPMYDVFIRKWLLSLIAAYEGHPVRSVLALTGGQNTGKTEFFRRLLPKELQKYYAESKLDAGKDDDLLMCQKLIVMDDEMGGKSKQDERRFKELTSKSSFSLRAPYARFNEDFKRLAVLCGTSNAPDVINDPTGNTRILPLEVTSINHKLYNSIDKDELFMEAYRLYKEGNEWQLNKGEITNLQRLSDEFEQIPYERELLTQFVRLANNEQEGQWLSSTEIKDIIERRSSQKIFFMRKFGIELRKMFGKPPKRNGIFKYFVHVIHYN